MVASPWSVAHRSRTPPAGPADIAHFRPGHRLVAELSNDEPLTDAHNALLLPDALHLSVGRAVTHKIYRDAVHRSRPVLPFTVDKAAQKK